MVGCIILYHGNGRGLLNFISDIVCLISYSASHIFHHVVTKAFNPIYTLKIATNPMIDKSLIQAEGGKERKLTFKFNVALAKFKLQRDHISLDMKIKKERERSC